MARHGTAIGIDVGGTKLRIARVSGAGEILDRRVEPISRDPVAALAHILATVQTMQAPDVVAVGLGVPSRVDTRRREVFEGGYLNLAGHAPAERIEAASGRPVVIDNDGNMALVAEAAYGAARNRNSAVMLTIGTGIGGAVLSEGKILRGSATAGQLGHVTVDHRSATICACGRRGCVETTSSGTALGRLIVAAGLPPETGVDALLDAQAAGEPVADTLLREWATPLRFAIDSIVATLDPEVVVLGGGLGAAACKALERIPAASSWFRCPVVPAKLDDDAGMIGAALSALAGRPPEAGRVSPFRLAGLR